MADSLYDLLRPHLPDDRATKSQTQTEGESRYLSRLLSLRLSDLTATEPESLQQASHSNDVSFQALSSRSHRTTTTSFDHLSTLGASLQHLSSSATNIRNAVPELDTTAVNFATSYSKSRDVNPTLDARKQSMLLSRQADKLQDILELPSLLSTAIASAGTVTTGGTHYSQALDLFAHIKRLQILFPDSALVQTVQAEAQFALKDMTTNLITSLRGQNIRLAAAIRAIGWLRRVMPELATTSARKTAATTSSRLSAQSSTQQDEDDFGAIFLCARLCTFLVMTEALEPLRDLADQETSRRLQPQPGPRPEQSRKSSQSGYAAQGQQTERYLKRYIEIFREQSFTTVSMFRNVFPAEDDDESSGDPLQLPSALATFPLQLVEIFMETIRIYLPNIIDPAARESLLMQVLYAGNSLGRLGADFSMMIAFLDHDPAITTRKSNVEDAEEDVSETTTTEAEWVTTIKKHRVQAARLEALAAGQDQAMRRDSSGITVK